MPGPAPSKTYSSKTQGTTPLDDPAFTDFLGYQGQVYEDRVGVYNRTIHASGSMASVTHIEGESPPPSSSAPCKGSGGCLRGTYREHAAGNFLIIDGEDIPPAASFLHGTGTGDDGPPDPLHQPRPLRPR
jgi:hypothetical protein